jgi:hypothetical protein
MLARFVVDSHARSQPKGANLEDRVTADMDDDPLAAARQAADPDVCSLAITTEKLLVYFMVLKECIIVRFFLKTC